MIFIHLLIGILLGKFYGHYFLFILGSITPDADHLYIIFKNKIFSLKRLTNTIKYEDKFGLKYKTPLVHSALGLVLFSSIIHFFNNTEVVYFSIAYLMHLLTDWTDIDEKYFLYPSKIKFRGFLPIWSKFEQVLTLILIILIIILFILLN